MYQLNYTEEAANDLQTIFNYIAEDSRERAVTYLGKMEKRILQLRDFPELGHTCKYPELTYLGIRVLPYENYLIFYTVNTMSEAVNVIRVLHGSVNYRNLL